MMIAAWKLKIKIMLKQPSLVIIFSEIIIFSTELYLTL